MVEFTKDACVRAAGRAGGAWRAVATLTLICLLSSLQGFAQFDTGTIAGAVTDPAGALVPHANVTVTNTGTSIQRTFQTDNTGNFVASALPFGEYVVSAIAGGFTETKTETIVLNVGATVHVNLALVVATLNEVVQVASTPAAVNTASTVLGASLNATQIANLPVNGRDVSGFLNVAPGSVNSTGLGRGSVNGLENIWSGLNITLDGQNATRGDVNGFLNAEGEEGARVTRASIDSVQEITFANNGYSAQYGHSLGPQMNIVTKSGTNSFHGTVFEFLRNDVLDARDFFETGQKQPLKLNQFGANLGGPIVKNKVFFFANYEGDRTHITRFAAGADVLSAYARSLFVPAMRPLLAQLAPLPAGCNAIPAPAACADSRYDSGTPGGSYLVILRGVVLPTTVREDTGSVRLDYNISGNDRLMFRYNINDSLTNYTFGIHQGQVAPEALRTQYGKIDETHIFSPKALNEFSVAVNRFYSDTNSNTPTPLTGFAGFFANLGTLPSPNLFNQITPFTVLEVFDTVTKTAGRHTLKVGTQIRANRFNEWLRPQQTYYFGSFHDLFNDAPFVLTKIGFPGFIGIRNSNWDFYAQDDWRVARTVTLNLGLRYDYNTAWRERHNQIRNFDVATQSFLPADQPVYEAPKGDFAPRAGIAWDPFGKGKTVIHGFGGLFYLPMQFGFGLTSNMPALASYNVNVFQVPFPLTYPSPNPPLIPGTQNVTAFPQHPKDPYATNWLFGIEQQLPAQAILTLNYTGNKTRHMQAGASYAALNANPANTVTQARRFSGFADENVVANVLSSNYDAFQLQVRRNSGRLNLQANYTWSHELDDLVNAFGAFSDPYDPSKDRSSGDIDVRHNFTAGLVYSLPELNGSRSGVRGLLGGWQTSSIIQTRSGLPVNVQLLSGFFSNPMRPNYVPGQSPRLDNAHWPSGSYNINAFAIEPDFNGEWGHVSGDVGRNALRGPSFFQWDFSVMKNFPIRERGQFQFRADLFNILNHPNFANPDGGICTSITPAAFAPNGTLVTPASCTPNTPTGFGGFGVSGRTIADASQGAIGNGTARQAQFSLKLFF